MDPNDYESQLLSLHGDFNEAFDGDAYPSSPVYEQNQSSKDVQQHSGTTSNNVDLDTLAVEHDSIVSRVEKTQYDELLVDDQTQLTQAEGILPFVAGTDLQLLDANTGSRNNVLSGDELSPASYRLLQPMETTNTTSEVPLDSPPPFLRPLEKTVENVSFGFKMGPHNKPQKDQFKRPVTAVALAMGNSHTQSKSGQIPIQIQKDQLVSQHQETPPKDFETSNALSVSPKSLCTDLDVAGVVRHLPGLMEPGHASLTSELLLAKSIQHCSVEKAPLRELQTSSSEARDEAPKFAPAMEPSLEQSIQQKEAHRSRSVKTPTPGMQRRGSNGHRKTPRQSFTTQLSETYTKANIPQQSYRTVSSPRPQRVQQQDSAQARQQASIPCDGSSDTTKYQRHERDPHGGRPEATPRNNTATEQSETSVGAVPFIAATPVTNIVSKSDRLTSKEYILRPVSSNSRPHSVHSNKATTLAKPFPEITNVSKIKKTRHRQPDQLDINSTSDVIVSAIPSTKSMSKPTLNYLKFLESGGTFMADLEKYEIQKDLVEAQKAQIAKLQGCNVESETLIRSLDAEKHSLGNKIKKLTGLCEKYKNHMNDVVSSQRILMQEASKMRAETKAASQEGKELSSEIREILNAQDLEQKKLRGSFSQVKGELKARIDQIRQDQDLHNQLSDRITELNNSVTMKDAELGRREIDCQGMSLKIDELERHLTSIRDQLAAKSHELAALSATSRDDSQLRSRLHVLESAQKQVNQEMNGAKAEVQVLQETALQTHDKYRQQEEKLRRSEVALTSALEQISALAAASKVDIDKAKQQVAEAANASKQEIAMRHNALVMNLELRRSEADDHLKTSKEDMKRIQDENVNYAQTVASMQAEISQADEKLSRMSSRIDGLNAQISSQEQLDKRAQTSRNEAESQLNLTKEELKATQDENANYCHHIETLQTEISRSDEALGQLSEKINGLEKEVRSQEQIHEREQNISTILSELASLRAENEAFQNETDQNLSGARQTQHEVVTQLQNVESLHQTQEDLQIEKSDLQNKYNLLRSTVTQHLSQTGALQSGESLDVWAANYAPKTSRNMVQLTQSAQRFRNNGVDFGANSKALPTNSRALDLFPTPQEALENALNRRATNPRDTVLGSLPGTNLRSVGAAVRRRPETAIVPHTDVQLLPSNSHPISQFSKIKTPRVANRISSALTPLATEDRAGRMSNGETSLDIIDRSKQAGKDVGRSETSAPVTSKYTQATMTRTLHSREMTTFMVENASSDLVPYSVLAPARSQTASSLTDVEPMMDLLEAVQSQEELNHAYQTNREAWRRTSNKNNSLDHGSGILPASHFSVTEAGGAIDDHDEITASMPQHLNTLDAVGKHRAQPTGLKSALKKSTRLTHADVVVAGKKNESMGSSVSNHTSKALKDVSLSGRGRNRNATRLNITSAGSDYNRVAIGARKSSNNTELGGYVQRRPVPASPLIAAPKRNLLKRKTSAISLREQDAKRLKAQSSRTRSPRATSQSHKRLSYSTASKAAV